MADKVWSQEQTSAARKLWSSRLDSEWKCRPTFGKDQRQTLAGIKLQCELTEAVELLKNVNRYGYHGMLSEQLEWQEKRREWLKRNTPKEGEAPDGER